MPHNTIPGWGKSGPNGVRRQLKKGTKSQPTRGRQRSASVSEALAGDEDSAKTTGSRKTVWFNKNNFLRKKPFFLVSRRKKCVLAVACEIIQWLRSGSNQLGVLNFRSAQRKPKGIKFNSYVPSFQISLSLTFRQAVMQARLAFANMRYLWLQRDFWLLTIH